MVEEKIIIDKGDMKIIELLILGFKSKDIAESMELPLTTIQRRVKRIFDSQLVSEKIIPNFRQLGFNKGLIHVYTSGGKLESIAGIINKMKGILTTSIHIGNSDLVAEFVFEDSQHLVKIFETIKALAHVERVLWSEEVSVLDGNGENISDALTRRWNGDKITLTIDRK